MSSVTLNFELTFKTKPVRCLTAGNICVKFS